MRIDKLLLLIALALLAGCAHKQAKNDAAAEPQKQEKAAEGSIVGTPAPGSKFAKLKLGMTMKEAIAKIGRPDNQWHRPTGKSAIPFYFGDDRWVEELAYKKEGRLTFNYGGDQILTGIVVNKAE
ncbi:MAG: hypothetical protein HY938_07630 [Nitrosomonadales bacterium]|nr:hypothetical protein [Nitrosomonadales bacterium]